MLNRSNSIKSHVYYVNQCGILTSSHHHTSFTNKLHWLEAASWWTSHQFDRWAYSTWPRDDIPHATRSETVEELSQKKLPANQTKQRYQLVTSRSWRSDPVKVTAWFFFKDISEISHTDFGVIECVLAKKIPSSDQTNSNCKKLKKLKK